MRYERQPRPVTAPAAINSPPAWPVDWRDGVALVAWLVIVLAAGASVGVLFPPGDWYQTLGKPSWNPPAWLFGPVWTALYVLLAIGAWLVAREPGPSADAERPKAWLAFALMAVLNLAWTPLFFGLKSPALAFLDISLLWGMTVWMTLRFGRVRPMAGYLQVPLVLWVSFALVLNGTIWLINS
ncbi:TspO/MBR family protein [Arenimonas sp.]|uniref:TspO/MBR family protein n=1 Tax=Arenimonas sp. TaxID=1872635 RepID=UPI0035B3FF64